MFCSVTPSQNMAIIKTTDWSQFLSEDSELPSDVVFNVMERGEEDDDEILNLEDWKTGQVSAHRFLLAGVSPVFRKEFFGPLKTDKDVIDIKETTIEAFSAMVNCIYFPDALQSISCPQTLCQILNLAERYQIDYLIKSVTKFLQKLPITSENMIFTATTAKNYAVFEDVSKMLIDKCGAFLKTQMKTPDQVFDFLHCSHFSFPDGDTELLIELMRANGKCPNCQMASNHCLDGKDVTGAETSAVLRNGLIVSTKKWKIGEACGFPCANSLTAPTGLATVDGYVSRQRGFGGMAGSVRSESTLPLKCIDHGMLTSTAPFSLKNPEGEASLVFACRGSSQLTRNRIVTPLNRRHVIRQIRHIN